MFSMNQKKCCFVQIFLEFMLDWEYNKRKNMYNCIDPIGGFYLWQENMMDRLLECLN